MEINIKLNVFFILFFFYYFDIPLFLFSSKEPKKFMTLITRHHINIYDFNYDFTHPNEKSQV